MAQARRIEEKLAKDVAVGDEIVWGGALKRVSRVRTFVKIPGKIFWDLSDDTVQSVPNDITVLVKEALP
jgi:hypothetical protein